MRFFKDLLDPDKPYYYCFIAIVRTTIVLVGIYIVVRNFMSGIAIPFMLISTILVSIIFIKDAVDGLKNLSEKQLDDSEIWEENR